ncbi:MAG: peptidyl-prolyl cis-trans isomerase [Acidobacteria bacterium]|nr:peptidyl-prolyl cis-trans isomerase [Acidobacteriota bacterium]
MTMLDRMRRHRAWLKWSLGIVVATFVLLYIPQFLGNPVAGTNAEVIATVDGREISAGTYRIQYLQQVSQIRAQYGAEITDQLLNQLGVGPRIVQRLVNDEAMMVEAERLGITVTDGELKERLVRLPMFQENGQFVGEAAYRQMLANARPVLRPADFERDLRRSLVAEKLQAAVTGWLRVSDADVEQEFRRRNEKVKLNVAVFTADKLAAAVQPTDAELQEHFSANQERYRVPEKRRVRYLAVDAETLRGKMTVTPAEVEARYKESLQTYSTPEQVRASHILFKTDGKDEAAVRKTAEGVLAKAKAGADFAALAKQYSEDEGSKASGGDLQFFSRGAMVKEFEDAAWALKDGEISGLVKSPFGFHIIKGMGKKAATTKTLDEVRSQIEDGIKFEKARAEASRLVAEIGPQLQTPADLDRVAKERGLTVGDSGLFARDEPLAGIGFAPAVAAEAFTLDAGKVSAALSTNNGYAFITVTEVKPSSVPALSEVREKVLADVARAKAVELARQRAAALTSAKTNFQSAAKAAGAAVSTTDAIARGAVLPVVGVSDAVDRAAFALKPGEVSQPIATDEAVVVVQLVDRQDVSPTVLEAERESIRGELADQRGGAFFEAYMAKAKARMNIQYNDAALRALTGNS